MQGFPEGYTADCWPLRRANSQQPSVQPGGQAEAKAEAEAERERLRFAVLGNAVTVDVARWIGERLIDEYECAPLRMPRLACFDCSAVMHCSALLAIAVSGEFF